MKRPAYDLYKGHFFHPLTKFSTIMSEKSWEQFYLSIKHLGQLVPIVRYDGLILDGRSRFFACLELNIKPIYVDSTAENLTQALEHCLAYNSMRCIGSAGQRAVVGAELLDLHENGYIDLHNFNGRTE